MSGPVPIASDAERVAGVSSVMVVETSPHTPPGDVALPTTSLLPAAPDAEKVTQAVVKEVTFPAATSEAFRKGKGQVSD